MVFTKSIKVGGDTCSLQSVIVDKCSLKNVGEPLQWLKSNFAKG
jgi:hypothetical protein